MDDRLAMIMAVVMVIFVHPEYFGADLGADFAADAAIWVYSGYA